MPKLLLVADDDESCADIYADIIPVISKGKFIVETVSNGEECLARLKREPKVDIVLLDIQMPIMDGAEVIRHVIKMNPLPQLKIIPHTGYGAQWLRMQHMEDVMNTPEFKSIVLETLAVARSNLEGILERLDSACAA
jgi:CheY-like chemotaxis protein